MPDYWLSNRGSQQLDWLNDFSPEQSKSNVISIRQKNHTASLEMLYILIIHNQNITVNLKLARPLKTGGFGSDKPFSPNNKSHQSYLTKDDEKIYLNLSWNENNYHPSQFQLSTNKEEEILRKMIDSGRCFAGSKDSQPIRYGEPIHVEPKWQINHYGEQFISANTPQDTKIFKIDSLWYLDEKESTIGLTNTGINIDLFRKLLSAPAIPIGTMTTVESRIKQICPDIPKPYSDEGQIEKVVDPVPCLFLYKTWVDIEDPESHTQRYYYYSEKETITAQISVAKLHFQYDNIEVYPEETKRDLYQVSDNILIKIQRNFELENKLSKDLSEKWSLDTINNYEEILDCDEDTENDYYIGDDDEAFHFSNLAVPNLKKSGWIITAENGYAIEVIQDDDVEWFSDLDESEYDWFGLNLGVIIDGEKVNILPLIVSYLKTANLKEVKKIKPNVKIPIQMSDGRTLMMPAKRLKLDS